MANVKISQLPSATTPLSGTEEIAIVQNNQTVKTTTESIRGGYKVYTALLTQSGGDIVLNLNWDDTPGGPDLVVGVTYQITIIDGSPDFTNVGAPNNNIGTYFVATGTRPTSWGEAYLEYNAGAPTVIVLENTIGNIWFTYGGIGGYLANLIDAFPNGKTYQVIGDTYDALNINIAMWSSTDAIEIQTRIYNTLTPSDDFLNRTPIEIRVYN